MNKVWILLMSVGLVNAMEQSDLALKETNDGSDSEEFEYHDWWQAGRTFNFYVKYSELNIDPNWNDAVQATVVMKKIDELAKMADETNNLSMKKAVRVFYWAVKNYPGNKILRRGTIGIFESLKIPLCTVKVEGKKRNGQDWHREWQEISKRTLKAVNTYYFCGFNNEENYQEIYKAKYCGSLRKYTSYTLGKQP